LTIGDLVEIPEIKTVIQMQDLKDPSLRKMIADTFVLTSEVTSNLRAVFTTLRGAEGRGIFLKGHFGSGKSHFLTMLSLLLKSPGTWDAVVSQEPSLVNGKVDLEKRRFLVAETSLVQHRSTECLEDIVLSAILEELGQDTSKEVDRAESRSGIFSRLRTIIAEKGFSGLVILIDELSEFLKSKPDARAYNEDIRYLQYLGEEAGSFPLWIVASLQEWIEETGEIHQDTFNKIKDRYRIRLNLGRAHIEELVSERLIRHKQGADCQINEIFDQVKSFFPTFPVTGERFVRLYPVHPATCALLDRLKPLFSEHRGVIDFIHYRLKGDRERNIPSMLDHPADRLLSPDVIFDHFLDRIRERTETQIYVERVFESCIETIDRVFPDQDQKDVARAAGKLLILFAISPVKYKYTVRHLAEMILFPVTSLESQINYQFLHDILDRLVEEGMYLRVEKRQDPLEDHFFVDLKADMAGLLRRRIKHKASLIFSGDRRLFWKTAAMVDSAYLPLSDWVEKGRQQVTTRWQHTLRSGTVLLRQLDEVSAEDLDSYARRQERSEEDYFLIVGTTHDREVQYRHVKESLLPRIREGYSGMFLFWLPAPFEGEVTWLKEFLAAVMMKEETASRVYDRSQESKELLEAFLSRQKRRITEHYSNLYYRGVLLWDAGEVDLSGVGVLSQEKFLSEFVPPLLEQRFPKHGRIQPYMDVLPLGVVRDMLMEFLLRGILIADNRSKASIRDVLEGILRPMGLTRKKGNQYELTINPRQNELGRCVLALMEGKESVPLEEIYWNLRKGEYGLQMPYFEILVLALLFSGHLVAYKVMERRSPQELSRTGLKGITALGRGEVVSGEFRQAISSHPLIPRQYRDLPLTLASQEGLWSELKAAKASVLEELESLKSRIQWARSFEAFRNMPWQGIINDIEDVKVQWEEVKVSLSSKDGLERFLRAGQREPFLENKLKSVESVTAFLGQAERALFVHQYITDKRLRIPEASDRGDGKRQEDFDRLRNLRSEILEFYEKSSDLLPHGSLEDLFKRFQNFQKIYTRLYAEEHARAKEGEQFEPFEKLGRSKRYDILQRFGQIEVLSVEHNYRSVNQAISSVLLNRCTRSPHAQLQARPICECGFKMGDRITFEPIKEIEKGMDMGVREYLHALKTQEMQERLLPYLEGLDLVNRKGEADAIRHLMELDPDAEGVISQLDELLTPRLIGNMNEAFRGKVVVVKRDLDRLYKSLIHRKYTLSQLRKILSDWLREETIGDDTFLHFVGKGEGGSLDNRQEEFRAFLESEFRQLVSLYYETGHEQFIKAMTICLWARQYDLSGQGPFEAFPFLEVDSNSEIRAWLNHLEDLASALRKEKAELFEYCIQIAEQDTGLIRHLWSFLSARSLEEIFKEESIFPLILKEAFERIVCGKIEELDLEALLATSSAGDDKEPHARLEDRKGDMVRTLRTYRQLRERIRILSSAGNNLPDSFSKWESLYKHTISPLPFLRETLQDQLKHIGVEPPPFLKEELRQIDERLHEVSAPFADFYRKSIPEWEKGVASRPMMIQDIPSMLSRKRNVPDYHKVCYVLMDGMRWDLWEYIKVHFFAKMPNFFRTVREGAVWSGLPTSTGSQLEKFEEALCSSGNRVDDNAVWKISGVDEKIHSEKGPLTHLFANVVNYLEIDVLLRFRDLPPRTLLFVFSDHGFVENPSFSRGKKYDSPRYIHGKDSPFEVIVPWAWIMRI